MPSKGDKSEKPPKPSKSQPKAAQGSARKTPPQPSPPRLQAIKLDDPIDTEADRQPLLPYPSALPRQESHGVSPCCFLLYVFTFLFAATLCYAIVAFTQSFACLGAPYLYVTHKGSKNVMKYSRDGCLLHEKVLWGVNNEHADLRSMALGSYHGQEALFVADSSANASGVLVFGACFQATSLRPFLTRVHSLDGNPSAVHAYGLALDRQGDLYVSFQDSGAVLRLAAEALAPLPLPANLSALALARPRPSATPSASPTFQPSLVSTSASTSTSTSTFTAAPTAPSSEGTGEAEGEGKGGKKKHKHDPSPSPTLSPTPALRRLQATEEGKKKGEGKEKGEKKKGPGEGRGQPVAFSEGTFVQLAAPAEGLRAVAWARGFSELWVADEGADQVAIVDRAGRLLGAVAVPKPIGLLVGTNASEAEGLIFVSCKASKRGGGAVLAVDAASRRVVRSFTALGMKHPAGLAAHGGLLFVADQSRGAVLAFNLTTARLVRVLAPKTRLAGPVEQLLLSPC